MVLLIPDIFNMRNKFSTMIVKIFENMIFIPQKQYINPYK